jgi:hypothetical protein
MTPNKKPNTAENFSTKFSQRVKNVMPVATSSPIAPVIKSSGMETVFLTDLKCDTLAGRINW